MNDTTTNSPTRRCAKCKQELPNTEEFFYRKTPKRLYARCKKCHNETSVEWSRSHPDKARKAARESHRRHQTIYNAQRDIWVNSNRDKVNETRRRRYRADPIKGRIEASKHRKREANTEGRYDADDIKRQLKRQKNKCYYCGKPMEKPTIEHIVPISRGGTNWPDNIVMACQKCNASKKDKLPHEWSKGGKLL